MLEERDAKQSALERDVDAYVNRTQGAMDENWGMNTKTGAKIRFYGFLRLDYYYNDSRMNNVTVPFWVLPERNVSTAAPFGVAGKNDNENAFDARLTRFGFDLVGVEVGAAEVTGRLETDFGNSNSLESRPHIRIRQAWLQAGWEGFKIRFGQDWDVISPLNPSVNAEALNWYVGNLGDRRPLAQFIFSGKRGQNTWTANVALGLTGAVDGQDLDASNGLTGVGGGGVQTSTQIDGYDAGVPHLQARFAASGPTGGRTWTVGVWGLVGRLETDNGFPSSVVGAGTAANNKRSFTASGLGIDATIPVGAKVTVQGEFWYGSALSDWRGGVGQSINIDDGFGAGYHDADVIDAVGGWLEAVVKYNERLSWHVGGTIDDPHNGDLPQSGSAGFLSGGLPPRTRNFAIYIGTRRTWGKNLLTGLDLMYWQTDYIAPTTADFGTAIPTRKLQGTAWRLNFYTQFNF